MVDSEVAWLQAQCKSCKHRWKPFGIQRYILPHHAILKCPKCDFEEDMYWYDSETQKKKIQKELGLTNEGTLITKISELENRMGLLEKELEIERQKREISETELKNMKEWAKIRENDFRDIELLAEEERQRMKNNEDMK